MKLSFRVLFLLIFIQKRNTRTANGLVNKALHKPTFQSGTLQWPERDANAKWSSAHAVDGRKACPSSATWWDYSGTGNLHTPWWQVDLEEVIKIGQIVVYGQPRESPPQLKGFRIYITTENITDRVNIAYLNNEDYGNGVFVVNIGHTHQTGRYVTLDLPMSTFSQRTLPGPLVLCEIEIFSPECGPWTYGEECSACSTHCFNGVSRCDKVTGACREGCEPGFMGPNCIAQCPVGKFGRNCAFDCSKHCYGGEEQCSKETGLCNQGCNDGYIGLNCTTQCADGTFGQGCSKFCHCADDLACNKETGRCPNVCDIMWGGDMCSEYKGLNFSSHQITTTQSDTYIGSDYSSSKAVDKSDNYNVDTCKCCSVAMENTQRRRAWWQIHLGREYLIDALSLFGRSDNTNPLQIQNAQVYAGNQSLSSDPTSGSLVYTVPSRIGNKYHFVHLLNSPVIASYFIVRLNQSYLTLCEFHLRNKDCPSGSFGEGCLHKCHCKDGASCDTVTGYCPNNKCGPGWKGDSCNTDRTFGYGFHNICHCSSCDPVNGTCDTQCDPGWTGLSCNQECVSPFFGYRCNQTCHCINGTPCNHINGTCDVTECDNGWTGHACDKECSAGTFGAGCHFECHCINGSNCEHINGTCERGLCDPGWTRHACDRECGSPSFGFQCNQTCHCINGTRCNHINGTCDVTECDKGWTGLACDKECSAGTFGAGCQSECHCINGSNCDHINGTCERGLCDPGWTGYACGREQLVEAPSQDSSDFAVAAGVSFAAFIVVAVAAGVGVFWYKRQKSELDEQQSRPLSNLDRALRQQQTRQERVSGNLSSTYTETSVNNLKGTEAKGEVRDDDEGGYYDFTKVPGIRIHELWDYIQDKTKNDCEQLFAEFKKLPSGLIYPCKSAEHLDNRGKTRYKQMYAYDHSRVILEEKNNKGTDYVNASYIDGFNKIRKFVASQGPTKEMIDDFWRMVWQLNTDKIVMLTNLVEQGATKCIQYWPPDEECSYGSFNVRVVQLDTDLDFDIRHLDVWREGESPRRIRQYHFKSWPDKNVPDSTWCLVKFWRAVQTDVESSAGPIVVHCSAGIGRTGTFIALDNLVHQARKEGGVRPFQIVQTLREQRVNMVQTKFQYVYLHEVLADALSFGTQFVWSSQFESMYMSLLQREDGGAKTRLEVQYNLIQKSLKGTESEQAEAPEYSNIKMVTLESDAYQPKLKTRGSRCLQQLRATLIPNFSSRNTFVVAMSPDKSTIEEFWSLVDDLNIKTVVMLTERSSSCYKTSCDLGAHDSSCQQFSVKRIEEKINKGHTERTFTFKQSQREEENHVFTVKQFEYTAWKGGYVVPGDTQSFIDFLEAILAWQPHVTESQPVLICDRDGFTRCGIVCVALNEIQRIKIEGGHVNIVQSVKTMKKRISKLIVNFEQFKFCYELVLAYLKTTEVYKNRLQSV